MRTTRDKVRQWTAFAVLAAAAITLVALALTL
jgi:hypothetical protein